MFSFHTNNEQIKTETVQIIFYFYPPIASRINVKVEWGSTFTFTRNSYIASILFTHVKPVKVYDRTHVKILRGSGKDYGMQRLTIHFFCRPLKAFFVQPFTIFSYPFTDFVQLFNILRRPFIFIFFFFDPFNGLVNPFLDFFYRLTLLAIRLNGYGHRLNALITCLPTVLKLFIFTRLTVKR